MHTCYPSKEDPLLAPSIHNCIAFKIFDASDAPFAKFDWSLQWWKFQLNYDTNANCAPISENFCRELRAVQSDYSKYNPTSIYQLNNQSKCNFFFSISLGCFEIDRLKWENQLCRSKNDITSTCNLFYFFHVKLVASYNFFFCFFSVVLVN